MKLVTYIKGFILDWSPELKYLVSIVDNDLVWTISIDRNTVVAFR